MKFEYIILIGLSVIFTLSMIDEIFHPGSDIFNTCTLTLPMISTFVIGFILGKSK